MLEKLRNFPLFGKKKLLLSFEYGVILAQTALENKVELTPELIAKAEEMIIGEFSKGNATRIAVDMIPNIISIFELDLSK
jgi:hypothetical protein